MSELLIVPAVGTSPTLAISDEAREVKKNLLHQALTTGPITNEKDRDRAIAIAGDIATHLKAVEKSRVEVKEPFLQMSREIDRVSREHVSILTGEKARIGLLVGEFEVEREKAKEREKQAIASSASLASALEAEERLEAAEKIQRPTGGALRQGWDIVVTDIKALYAAHPQCVELTAKNMAITDLLKIGITPAGVTATPKVAFAARATTPRLKS